jgi:hypothetical protein
MCVRVHVCANLRMDMCAYRLCIMRTTAVVCVHACARTAQYIIGTTSCHINMLFVVRIGCEFFGDTLMCSLP